jgi:hypothetical protein
MPLLTKPRLNLTQDKPQTEPKTPHNNQNKPQETTPRLVDVIGNNLTTTSIQLQPLSAFNMAEESIRGITPSSFEISLPA